MSGRLKELRDGRRISQEMLGREIGTSQQNLSRYELDINTVPADMLIRLATYYNVTTDYILGVSDMKRNMEGEMRITKVVDENYDFLEMYRKLNAEHREVVWHVVEDLKKIEDNLLLKKKRTKSERG